jgi:acetoacetate decarboxylase
MTASADRPLRTLDEFDAMPYGWPYYEIPAAYEDNLFDIIRVRVPASVTSQLLPAPLVPDDSEICAFCSIDVPVCPAFGPFHESYVLIACRLFGALGYYCSLIVLDNPRALCAGREVYGAPKVLGAVEFEEAGESRVCTTSINDSQLLRAQVSGPELIDASALPELGPQWSLRIIAGPGGQPALRQLITAWATGEKIERPARLSHATLELGAAGGIDLRVFEPFEVIDAYRFISSRVESYGAVVYDYLSTDR